MAQILLGLQGRDGTSRYLSWIAGSVQ